MKSFLFALCLLSIGTASAASKTCTFEEIQTLSNAEGADSARVREILQLETPNFSCKVSAKNFAFAAVCDMFVYTQLNYDVVVGPYKIKATVKDGAISCTNTKVVELAKATISE